MFVILRMSNDDRQDEKSLVVIVTVCFSWRHLTFLVTNKLRQLLKLTFNLQKKENLASNFVRF